MKNLYKALSEFQSKVPSIKKESDNPFFKSKYAGLDTILPVITPILKDCGLVISQVPVTSEGVTYLNTVLAHIDSGEVLESRLGLLLVKQDPQGQGSAITYARRYAIVSMLGLNTEEDDDGNKASGKTTNTLKGKGNGVTNQTGDPFINADD